LRPYLEKPHHKKIFKKRASGLARGEGPEFKSQYWKKKKEFAIGIIEAFRPQEITD
jgi:hypothetical protein